ncbi:ABC transporter permease [Listeria aquatica]|uniref:ABC transporter permease n=1 Tax=Listeria aquatica TaxID=1494960 RepID=A0A841ZMC6_9LIST|nr:ABC transporter permease [Listeria aquatica]MBC1520414.1 ABC transporter permease [Listeria aquatica]
MNKFWVITKQVYKRHVKTKSFIISLLLPLIVAGIALLLPKIMDYFGNDDSAKISVLSNNPAFVQVIKQNKEHFKVNDSITTKKAAEKALNTEKIDGYLTLSEKNGKFKAMYTTRETAGNEIMTQLSQSLTAAKVQLKAAEYGLDQQKLTDITSLVPVKNQLKSDKQLTESQKDVMQAANLFLTLIIFFFVISYANIVAAEIATEKGTRIMEVILSSVSATTHFLAKLTAIVLMLLTQIGCYLLVGFIAMLSLQKTDMIQGFVEQLANFPVSYLILNLLFIFFGLLLYIVLAAMAGSLVPNVETVAQFIYPLTIFSIVGYWGSIVATSIPDNIVVIIGSYIPVFSPMMMLARMNMLAASDLGIFISLGILIITVGLSFLLTFRLYKSNVLLYSNEGLFKTLRKSFAYAKK